MVSGASIFPHENDELVQALSVLKHDFGQGLTGETVLRIIRKNIESKRQHVTGWYHTRYMFYEQQLSEYNRRNFLMKMFMKKPIPPELEGEDQVFLDEIYGYFSENHWAELDMALDELQRSGMLQATSLEREKELSPVRRVSLFLTGLGEKMSEAIL